MPMDSSYNQFILSLLVLAEARRVMISSKKKMKANSKGNASVYRASSNYWPSRLSCCLQKSIAASIVNRSKLINGDMIHTSHFTTPTINLMRTSSSNPDFDISILTIIGLVKMYCNTIGGRFQQSIYIAIPIFFFKINTLYWQDCNVLQYIVY
jgi:hypothetical protein